MKKFVLLLSVLFLISLVNTSFAEKFVYPSENPIFSIVFPDDWQIELDEEMLHASPEDESIYLGLWALGVESIDDALDALDEIVGETVVEPEFDEPGQVTVNDIAIFYVDGKGTDEEGDNVTFSVALFSPDGETVFIVFSYGTPEAEKLHGEEWESIVKSITAE